ncbi:MAG: hypothetical protein D6808_05690 [Candidatus Dadabacteria bacterium]|nr:MAG: hypothetical protein D6808_05690 [Candidatus Dadabacteria bacterium]
MDWISTFLIVFREVVEISVALVLLIAATRGVAGRDRWILAGIALGIAASIAVSRFVSIISHSFQGVGQELLNGWALAISTLLIGYTVVWMGTHGKKIARQISETGSAVLEGKKPLYALCVLIGLTVFRDGAEIVLLSHGLFVASKDAYTLLVGCAGGLLAGVLFGIGMYKGLVRIKTDILFMVLSILLALLAAGMASQSVAFFSAAGVLPYLSEPLWDTSSLLSESSILGGFMHIVIGYSSRPTGMQVISYFGVLGAIWVMFRISSRSVQTIKVCTLFLGIVSAYVFGLRNTAYAIDKIYSPIVHEGEVEIEQRGTYTFDSIDSRDAKLKDKMGIGFTPASRWGTELYFVTVKSKGEEAEIAALDWENRFQLFEQGEHWLDIGLYGEYALSTSGGADKVEGKLLLEKEIESRFVSRANIIFEREVGAGSGDEIEGGVSMNLFYRYHPHFMPAVEAFYSVEDITESGSYAERELYLGPAVYGAYGGWRYELSLVKGVTSQSTDWIGRWVLEYEFYLR